MVSILNELFGMWVENDTSIDFGSRGVVKKYYKIKSNSINLKKYVRMGTFCCKNVQFGGKIFAEPAFWGIDHLRHISSKSLRGRGQGAGSREQGINFIRLECFASV